MRKALFVFQALAIVLMTMAYTTVVVVLMTVARNKNIFFPMVRSWSRMILRITGVRTERSGMSFPKNESYVYVANHSSLFDIPVLLATLPGNVRIMYKKELEKIPFMGWALRHSSFIGIERMDKRDAMRGIEAAIQSVKTGESVVIFAEGTRSHDGKLGEFKRGGFLLAARAEKLIVPVAIIGAMKILPKKSLQFVPGFIKVVNHCPIQTETPGSKEKDMELMHKVHGIIAEMLKTHQGYS